jgi:hypothetical protein
VADGFVADERVFCKQDLRKNRDLHLGP